VGELGVAFLDDDPDFLPGLADERGHDRLAGLQVAGRDVPGTVLVAGVVPLAEQHLPGPTVEDQMHVAGELVAAGVRAFADNVSYC